MMLPPVELLSLTGMAVVAAFGMWKLQVAPRLMRRRAVVA
jgi:hypothetical protein